MILAQIFHVQNQKGTFEAVQHDFIAIVEIVEFAAWKRKRKIVIEEKNTFS